VPGVSMEPKHVLILHEGREAETGLYTVRIHVRLCGSD
jgi:hypothetical protein